MQLNPHEYLIFNEANQYIQWFKYYLPSKFDVFIDLMKQYTQTQDISQLSSSFLFLLSFWNKPTKQQIRLSYVALLWFNSFIPTQFSLNPNALDELYQIHTVNYHSRRRMILKRSLGKRFYHTYKDVKYRLSSPKLNSSSNILSLRFSNR